MQVGDGTQCLYSHSHHALSFRGPLWKGEGCSRYWVSRRDPAVAFFAMGIRNSLTDKCMTECNKCRTLASMTPEVATVSMVIDGNTRHYTDQMQYLMPKIRHIRLRRALVQLAYSDDSWRSIFGF